MTTPHAVPVRRTAREREERRIRIMAMVRSGFSYEEIARDERVSRERIRQIVTQSLKTDDRADRVDQARLQMARLEPALRLAARGVDNGKLSAISALLKVLDRLDKYGAVVELVAKDYEGAHERLMTFVNKAAERVLGPPPADWGAHRGEASGTAHSGQAEASAEPKNLETDSLGLGAL
ncbi:MAG TPA: hypothetical protein VGL41_10750 [Roseiarcus sp.]|jgi:hypothetical protein